MEHLKYTYSQLSSNTVCHLVTLEYDLPEIVSCKFYVLGLHDNYLIESEYKKYILRIYRNDWCSTQEVQFELELLAFLGAKDAPVATPFITNNGDLNFTINSPEGKRIAALFCYAEGFAPENEITVEQSTLLGKVVANVHQLSESFETNLSRQEINIPYLLDESVISIKPFLDSESWNYLNSLQDKLKENSPSLSKTSGIYGICSGDINSSNFHINNKNEITLFDFDQCGYGHRAFEIGKFISSIQPRKTKREIANAFITGYQQVRKLEKEELAAIPYYELLSVIWIMAIHTNNADRIGHKYLEKSFWDRRLTIIKELDKRMHNNKT